MKKYFTGEVTPPRKRVTTCQKCIRTPDIERVGKTARHGTYFEMLGNFSLRRLFQARGHRAGPGSSSPRCWRCRRIRLWVTIYEDDDEAFDIWTKEVGVAGRSHRRAWARRITSGSTAPAPAAPAPRFILTGARSTAAARPTCGVGCDCDRYVEFWNLVFTQFDSDGRAAITAAGASQHRHRHGPGAPGLHHAGGGQPL